MWWTLAARRIIELISCRRMNTGFTQRITISSRNFMTSVKNVMIA
jgi:hypothetical protein